MEVSTNLNKMVVELCYSTSSLDQPHCSPTLTLPLGCLKTLKGDEVVEVEEEARAAADPNPLEATKAGPGLPLFSMSEGDP